MYVYNVTDSAPNLTYLYFSHFDLTQNGPKNPFSAGPESAVSAAPRGITAWTMTLDMGTALAFVGIRLYVYNATIQHWTDEGEIVTPCTK